MAEKKELEVISGNGSEIQISKVYEHLSNVTPENSKEGKKPKNIVVPKVVDKNKTNKKDDKEKKKEEAKKQ